MSNQEKKGIEAIVMEVEAAKDVGKTITELCSKGNFDKHTRALLDESLATIQSVTNNLIQALPSNQRVACLRLQKADKLTKKKKNEDSAGPIKKRMKKNVIQVKQEVRELPKRQVC